MLRIEHNVGLFNYNISTKSEIIMSNKTEKITIRITEELKNKITKIAIQQNMSIGSLIRNYLNFLTTINSNSEEVKPLKM